MTEERERDTALRIEGRNAVLEAFRSGRTIDKLFVLEHCQDGPVQSILREAKKTADDCQICPAGKTGSVVRDWPASGRDCDGCRICLFAGGRYVGARQRAGRSAVFVFSRWH